MKGTALVVALALPVAAAAGAQETKPVPKGSTRIAIAGCSAGYVFTVGRPSDDSTSNPPLREGVHLRMNGAKKLIDEIKGQEGSRIEITGLVRNGQIPEDGIRVGGSGRVSGGPSGGAGATLGPGVRVNQIMIDVEGWRRIVGDCRSR